MCGPCQNVEIVYNSKIGKRVFELVEIIAQGSVNISNVELKNFVEYGSIDAGPFQLPVK